MDIRKCEDKNVAQLLLSYERGKAKFKLTLYARTPARLPFQLMITAM
jgi:hypothetical protein